MKPQQHLPKVTFSHVSSNSKPTKYTSYFVVLAIVKLRRRRKRSRHRRYVLEQWLKTQRSYKVDLQLAIFNIKRPLLEAGLIEKEGVGVLCPEFEQMRELSDEMIKTVGVIQKQKNMNRIVIGPELIKFGNFYKIYGPYFGNRMRSQQLLKKLFQENPDKMRSLQQNLKKNAGSLDQKKQHMSFSACLQQPQYRMFKYVLLLKQYIKKMPHYHMDYEKIKQAQTVFEQINQKNNELMGRLEAEEKKRKLDRLFGKSLPDSSNYIVEMTAETLYFPVKLYIFSNLVIVASVQKIFGFQEERKYLNIYLNEFSYVVSKPDNKYFKNVTFLCGVYDAIHFFSEDPGSKQEIINIFQRIISKLQASCCSRRKKQKGMGEMSGKLSFQLQIGTKQTAFAPEIRTEVMHIQVRPLGTFTNDTVYLTRFASPLWEQDCALVGMQQIKLQTGSWQLVEVHLSQVKELYQSLCQQYPNLQFPKIDPLTKEMNVFTESKKNTKMFEVRGYLFQQFFNFVLRNPTVMRSPLQIVHKFKIIPTFWQYIVKKNQYVSGRAELSRKTPQKYLYGEYHCKLCEYFLKCDFQQLLKVRYDFLHGKRMDHCFNAFSLFRMRICALSLKSLESLEKILLRELHQTGRMDYALLPRDELFKRYQEMAILACGQTQKHLVLMDYRRKVGQMMIDLGYFLGLEEALDCRLILRYQNKERILDQDQIVFDLIQKYQLPATQRQEANRQSRYSVNVTSLNKEEGILSFFTSIFKSSIQSCLVFRKVIYLPKEIEINAMTNNSKRGKYVTDELYARLYKGEIPLEPDDWAEACTIWLILNHFQVIRSLSLGQLMAMVQEKVIPPEKRDVTEDKGFLKIFADIMESFKKRAHQPLVEREVHGYYRRCIRVFYRQVKSYTYLTSAVVRTVPLSVISDNRGEIKDECWLGINYKQFLVFRQLKDATPAVRLSLQDLKMTHTTFSLFLDYNSFVALAMQTMLTESQTSMTNAPQDPKRTRLRFDSKLLYHFSYLMQLYMNLRKIFPMMIL